MFAADSSGKRKDPQRPWVILARAIHSENVGIPNKEGNPTSPEEVEILHTYADTFLTDVVCFLHCVFP